ncbi:DUF2950 domain-containing protein [Chitinibacteraceae bacterium HSL-7]
MNKTWIALAQLGAMGLAQAATGFTQPEAAGAALASALERSDEQALAKLFDGDRALLHSGDAVADEQARQHFLEQYRVAHRWTDEGGAKVLEVGEQNVPFAIPLKRAGAQWQFDVRAGRTELLNRRIGANELDAIQSVRAFVDAQYDYLQLNPMHADVPVYARYLISTPGLRDGLWWPAIDEGSASTSPLGEAYARAASEGYTFTLETRTPYHGYFYRMLAAQGAGARDGAYNYVASGKMMGGFALVAWPASYGVSGVKTFIVNHDGVVYERDLGARTADLARSMTAFDPAPPWKPVQ